MTTTIRLGIPTVNGNYSPETTILIDHVQHDPKGIPGLTWQYRSVANCYCNFYARNKLIYDMKNDCNNYGRWTKNWKAPYDYFLSADDDTAFTTGAVQAMISMARSIYNNGIIAGAYVSRWDKNLIVAGHQLSGGKNHCMTVAEYRKIHQFPYAVAWAGNGMLLIPAKILNVLPIPLYQHVEHEVNAGEYAWYHSDQSLAVTCEKYEVPIYLCGEEGVHRGEKIPL
jgi:hypothetical protein